MPRLFQVTLFAVGVPYPVGAAAGGGDGHPGGGGGLVLAVVIGGNSSEAVHLKVDTVLSALPRWDVDFVVVGVEKRWCGRLKAQTCELPRRQCRRW